MTVGCDQARDLALAPMKSLTASRESAPVTEKPWGLAGGDVARPQRDELAVHAMS